MTVSCTLLGKMVGTCVFHRVFVEDVGRRWKTFLEDVRKTKQFLGRR
jgi:hypothetical protein